MTQSVGFIPAKSTRFFKTRIAFNFSINYGQKQPVSQTILYVLVFYPGGQYRVFKTITL